MFSLFYRNRQLLWLSLILIVVWGLSSLWSLPRLEDPELVSRQAIVKTFLPGADAERIEALITEKISTELREIEEISSTNSSSRAGTSVINLELSDQLRADQVEVVWSEVQDKLNIVTPELPPGTTEPELERIKIKAYALLTALTWESSQPVNYGILRRLSEEIETQLSLIPGTESTEFYGEPTEEILVEIESEEIALRGLSVAELAQQLAQRDAKQAAGELTGEDNDLNLEITGEFDSLERIRNLPINYGAQGQFVRLGDIAQVSRAIAEPVKDLSLISGKPGITIGVFVESEKQLDVWTQEAEKILEQFRQQLPEQLALKTIFAQSRYISNRLQSLAWNLCLGAILVFAITWIMMGIDSAMVVGLALPLSLLMVFGWMGVLGIPLHQMSITGLIVALGILIDTAIVMVDEVNHRLRQSIPPETAIAASIGYLGIPLLSSTLTTIIAFMPIALLSGSTGEFVGTIGISVILAVSSSLLISLTIIPSLAALRYQSKGKFSQGLNLTWLSRLYRQIVSYCVARPLLTIALSLSLPLIGFIQAGNLEQQFFPAADRDQLQIQIELPETASITSTTDLVQQMRSQLLELPAVKDVHWFIGQSAPRFYYNLSGQRENQSNFAQALVQLDSLASNSLTNEIQTILDQNYPTAQGIVRQLEQGPPYIAPIEIHIYGSDLTILRELGETVRAQLWQIPEVTHTRTSLGEIRPQIAVAVDEEEAILAGFTPQDLAQILETTLSGTTGGSILEATEEMPVRVRLAGAQRGNLAAVGSLDLVNGSQANLPLSSLAEIELTPTIAQITQRDGERVNTVDGFIQAGVLPAQVLAQLPDNWQLPPGYRLEFGGEAEERSDAITKLLSTVSILTVLMIAILVLSLGSFTLAGLIGVVAVASFGLGLLSVGLFGYPFGFNPIIGTVGLIGVAINDSIVVLAALKENPLARQGKISAITEVAVESTRHVVTTTLTTMVGFVPLLIGGGEFWPPLAVAIAGGVGGATLLALFFIPAAYQKLKTGY